MIREVDQLMTMLCMCVRRVKGAHKDKGIIGEYVYVAICGIHARKTMFIVTHTHQVGNGKGCMVNQGM